MIIGGRDVAKNSKMLTQKKEREEANPAEKKVLGVINTRKESETRKGSKLKIQEF